MSKTTVSTTVTVDRVRARRLLKKRILMNWELYLLILPTIAFFLIFKYAPMYGIQIAFKDFVPSDGIWGSQWVGFENFTRFFKSYQFKQTLGNTVYLSLLSLFLSFPIPIIFALLLNQTESKRFKKTVQTVSYAPHFISTVVMVGLLFVFLSPTSGPINAVLKVMGKDTINFMGEPGLFRWVYVLSGIL